MEHCTGTSADGLTALSWPSGRLTMGPASGWGHQGTCVVSVVPEICVITLPQGTEASPGKPALHQRVRQHHPHPLGRSLTMARVPGRAPDRGVRGPRPASPRRSGGGVWWLFNCG